MKRLKAFLPVMNFSQYYEAKAAGKSMAAKLSGRGRDNAARAVTNGGTSSGAKGNRPFWMSQAVTLGEAPVAANVSQLIDIEGASDVDGEMPPDTHGAIGLQQFVETTNSHVDIFDRNDPTNRTSIRDADFFGYYNQALFDKRAVYDSIWNRWVITADAFPESPDVQYFFVAISSTSSANDPFFIYQLNVTFNSGDFWDYPQLGMDQDAVIVTANVFDVNGNYKGADMFAVAKARLYNGLGFSVPVFSGLAGTLAPPIVLDQNANTFLIAAQPSGSALQLYTLTNSGRNPGIALAGPIDVPVDAYDMPPPAQQPGTAATLDTLDGRFVNASMQNGSLWCVHTINVGGLPTPRFYQIDTSANAVIQSGYIFADGPSSNDWNASIASNSDNDVFVTWSSTDPPQGINAQVRYSACDHNTFPAVLVPGSASPYASPTFFTGGRWGDYSAVTVDPTNPRQAWLVNEDITSNGDWGSRIDEISL